MDFIDSQSNDMEVVKKMEDEHLRLQRQVRGIEADRLQRNMGVHPQFRRQDQLLKVLKAEYVNLTTDLKVASKGAHKKIDRRRKIELKRSLLFRMKTEQDFDSGTTVITQLEELLQRNNRHRLQLHKTYNARMGQMKERRGQVERRLVSTENRLENAMLRFNVVQCENKKIREDIEHMLRDRAIFNQSWQKMQNLLTKGKKFLTDLFESSYLAYDQRDEWCTKLRSMAEKGKVDQMVQLQEMRDLQKAFDHEMKLYHFLAKKGVVRINKQQEQKEEQLRIKNEEKAQEDLDAHLKLLDNIMEYTQEESISRITEKFRSKEQENLSLYTMLTEYCAENVVLEKGLKVVKQHLFDRRDWNEAQEDRRVRRIQQLQIQLEAKRERNELMRQLLAKKERVVETAVGNVAEMFKMLDCSLIPFEGLLGDKMPTRWTLDLSFQLMTERINEYIQTVYYTERVLQKRAEKPEKRLYTSSLKKFLVRLSPPECWTSTPITDIVPTDPCPACVEARWLSRVTESVEVPFTKKDTLDAIKQLTSDPSYVRSDRIHPIADCRVPSSRLIIAARIMAQ